MSKKLTAQIGIVMAIVLLITTPVFAASTKRYVKNLSVKTYWQDIATASQGFNSWVGIHNWSGSPDELGMIRADIRMIGKNGNVVWEESKSIPGKGSRAYWCGSDVYKVQIKLQSGVSWAFAYEASGEGDLR